MGDIRIRQRACTLLCWILISTCVLPASVFAKMGVAGSPNASSQEPSASPVQKELLSAWEDPFFSALKNSNDMPVNAPLEKDDPSLDADPFFLRAQQWVNADFVSTKANPDQAEGFVETDDHLLLRLAGASAFLKLGVPLKPVLLTPTHVFFSAPENSDIFEKKKDADQTDAAGEGLFFISRLDFLKAATKHTPVPFYFFPLPGSGWTGIKEGFHLPEQELVVFANTLGEPLAIQESDVEQVEQAEHLNLTMAIGTAFRSAVLSKQGLNGPALPPKNSTAGFGMLFTGLDADRGNLSVFAQKNSRAIWDKIAQFSPFAKAHANGNGEEDMLQARLLRLAIVVVTVFLGSVLLKYTLFKKHFAAEVAKNPELAPKGVGGKIKLEAKAVGSVFAHSLMTVSQFASVWFGNVVEFLSDRLAPSLLSGQNSLVRKFLENTVFFVRDASKKIPVNLKVWLLGGLVFGAVDTLLYYVQMYYVIFWVGKGIAENIPMLTERANEAFAQGNEDTARLREYEVLSTGTSYLTSGAFWFSADLQNQQMAMVEGEVDKTMMNEGKNPALPQNSGEKERRVRESLEAELKKAGLPGQENFLFDAHALWESLFRFLGYDVPADPKETPESYFAKSRPGLLIPSVKRALHQAEKLAVQAEQSGDKSNVENIKAATQILQETLKKLRLLNLFVRAPGTVLFPDRKATGGKAFAGVKARFLDLSSDFKKTRQQMVALSYEGSFEDEIRNIPTEWVQKIGEPGSVAAGKLFRASMHSYLTGDTSVLPAADLKAVKKEKPLKKPKVSKVMLWQEKKILQSCQERYTKSTGQVFEASTASAEQKKLWQSLYSESYMNRFGLYPEYDSEVLVKEKLEESAWAKVNQKISADPKLQQLLSTFEPAARERFVDQMQAEALVSEYLAVTSNTQKVPALSPAQPGKFQKFRQRAFFRNSKVATRMLRGIEAFWPENSIRPGLSAWMDRTIPSFADFKLANARAYRSAVTGVGATYWFSKYFWLNALSPAMWLMSLMFRFTIGIPTQFLNRAFRMQGVQPMAKVSTVVVFAFIFSWATFWGAIPQQLFAGDFKSAWEWGADKVHQCERVLLGDDSDSTPTHGKDSVPSIPIPR